MWARIACRSGVDSCKGDVFPCQFVAEGSPEWFHVMIPPTLLTIGVELSRRRSTLMTVLVVRHDEHDPSEERWTQISPR